MVPFFIFVLWVHVHEMQSMKAKISFSVLFTSIPHYGCSINITANEWTCFIHSSFIFEICSITNHGWFVFYLKFAKLVLSPSLKHFHSGTSESIFCLATVLLAQNIFLATVPSFMMFCDADLIPFSNLGVTLRLLLNLIKMAF